MYIQVFSSVGGSYDDSLLSTELYVGKERIPLQHPLSCLLMLFLFFVDSSMVSNVMNGADMTDHA